MRPSDLEAFLNALAGANNSSWNCKEYRPEITVCKIMMRAQSATEECCKFYGEQANSVARIGLGIVPDNLYGKSRESASLRSSFKIFWSLFSEIKGQL